MLIRDITILKPDFHLEKHQNVWIKQGRFRCICPTQTDEIGRREKDDVVEGKNRLLIPGFYNTHCHVPMTLTRGLGEGLCLNDWLTKKMFPFEKKMSGDDCFYGALLGIMELLSGGCVSVSDMYFHILNIEQAFEISGMKANICHGLTMKNPDILPENLKGWRDTLTLLEKLEGKSDGRIQADMGLHSEYTSTEALVRAVADFAKERGMRIHTHISETKKEQEECKMRHNDMTPVQYFKECGIFENPVIGAHGVWLEKQDLEILSESGATLSHCISSNLKLGSGVALVSHWLDRGINAVIATDGASSNNNLNMMEEMHLASMVAKGSFLDAQLLPPEQILKMATVNGAKAQGRDDCGKIEEGYKADFAIINLDTPNMIPSHNLLSNLVYSAQSSDIYMTVVDGEILYKDGEFLTIDRERVIYEVKKRVERICSQL